MTKLALAYSNQSRWEEVEELRARRSTEKVLKDDVLRLYFHHIQGISGCKRQTIHCCVVLFTFEAVCVSDENHHLLYRFSTFPIPLQSCCNNFGETANAEVDAHGDGKPRIVLCSEDLYPKEQGLGGDSPRTRAAANYLEPQTASNIFLSFPTHNHALKRCR
jgi:hypothetical protein